jgi:hypothetical protein
MDKRPAWERFYICFTEGENVRETPYGYKDWEMETEESFTQKPHILVKRKMESIELDQYIQIQ